MSETRERTPNGLGRRLYQAQNGMCFHCDLVMDHRPHRGKLPNGWTKEHILPRGKGGSGVGHGFVLAHFDCNSKRGSRPPTDAEILRTMCLYASLGLSAFSMLGNRPLAKRVDELRALLHREGETNMGDRS